MELHRALHSLSGELTLMGRVDEPDHVRVPVRLGDIRAIVQAGARMSEELTDAVRDVLAERRRQQDVEGWTPDHDDVHTVGEMADAAACYAARAHSIEAIKQSPPPGRWPWSMEWWKPDSVRRMLVKAAALLLAEIERLDRADARARVEAEGRAGRAGGEG